ncbi:hypothetical protein CPLU01_05822 [Colletotrichum plurivorum]|uniref:Uncharacterized protein n=1 Tax=Colletotrichum plurivorum TaxID=2175906 RepID=A0A8H6NHV2_9PEZI|nr:hypothetical protein CPLU01_05822 [Colletotrichum plurivorum]
MDFSPINKVAWNNADDEVVAGFDPEVQRIFDAGPWPTLPGPDIPHAVPYQPYDMVADAMSNFALGSFAPGGQNVFSGFENIQPFPEPIADAAAELQALGINHGGYDNIHALGIKHGYDTILDEHPVKRQRLTEPDHYVRATTPDYPPPTSFTPLPGSLTGTVYALSISSSTLPSDVARLQATVSAIINPATAPGALPPPSPRVKHMPVVQDKKVLDALKNRRATETVTIKELLPKEKFEPYEDVSKIPEGPEREAAKERNNSRSEYRTIANKARNCVTAKRTRDRKDKKIAVRGEKIAQVSAERDFWKAVAVGMGADEGAWENLAERFREEMIADRRFWWEKDYDADDEADEEEGVKEAPKKSAGRKKAAKTADEAGAVAKKVTVRKAAAKADIEMTDGDGDYVAPKTRKRATKKAQEKSPKQVAKQASKKGGAAKLK